MILPVSDINIEGSSSLKSLSFSIDPENQGLIMEMFRKKIYEDPISSIIREIGSNARDANRENNKSDIPIEFIFHNENKLLNNSNLKLEIKDSGIGISPDRMENVFVKYTTSTKTNSNEFTGGFGIGAKTPFAYKDIFNITTISNGIKYYYVAYIDESKKGKVDLQYTENTDEDSGTSIIVPIDKNDEQAFYRAVIYYTSFWKIKPIINNNIYNVDLINIYETDDFIVYYDKNNFYKKQNYVLIDEVPYTIQETKKIIYQENVNNYSFKLCLKFKNGDLDISLNRETLQYNDNTIDKLNDKFQKVYDNLFKLINDYLITNSISYLDCCQNYEKINKLSNEFQFAYSWVTTNSKTTFKFDDLDILAKFSFYVYSFHRVEGYDNTIEVSSIKPSDLKNSVFFKIDRFNSTKMNYLYELYDDKNIVLFLIKERDETRYRKNFRYSYQNNFADVLIKEQELIKNLNIVFEDFDNFVIPKEKKQSIKKIKNEFTNIKIRIISTDNRYYRSSSSDLLIDKKNKITKNTNHIYVYYTLDSIVNYYNVNEYQRMVFSYYTYFNQKINSSNMYSFIVINKRNIKDVIGFSNIISYEDIEKEMFLKLKGINKLLMYYSLNKYVNEFSLDKIHITKNLDRKIEKIKNKISKTKFKNQELFLLLKNTPESFGNSTKNNTLINLKSKVFKLKNTYPLLKVLQINQYKYHINEINEYISLINNKHLLKK